MRDVPCEPASCRMPTCAAFLLACTTSLPAQSALPILHCRYALHSTACMYCNEMYCLDILHCTACLHCTALHCLHVLCRLPAQHLMPPPLPPACLQSARKRVATLVGAGCLPPQYGPWSRCTAGHTSRPTTSSGAAPPAWAGRLLGKTLNPEPRRPGQADC